MFWTPASIARVTGGAWLREPADPDGPLQGLSTDSRAVLPGQVYLALRGERFDGHDFVTQALAAGAAMAIVDRDLPTPVPPGEGPPHPTPLPPREGPGEGVVSPHATGRAPDAQAEPTPTQPPLGRGRSEDGAAPAILRVADTLAALQALAGAYRDTLRDAGCKVIAVTGSNGKTTTRNLIHTVLSSQHPGTQSPKSFNNHIGVPLTLLAAREDHAFVVVEIGSNHPGEVAALAQIVRPDAAVVTSIGHEHMEFFGTLENVAKEEFSVAEHVAGGGPVFAPPRERLPEGFEPPAGVQTFERDPAVPDDFPLPGDHNRRNAAAAAAVARWFGMGDAAIAEALRSAAPVEGRLQTLRFGDVTVIHDAYNANPSSVREALATLAKLPAAGRRVAVLGDMFELGDEAPALHRGVGDHLAALDAADPGAVSIVVTVGRLSMFTAEALLRRWPADRVRMFAAWSDGLPEAVASMLAPGDVVLLKASRGMRLERLLPAIERRSQAS